VRVSRVTELPNATAYLDYIEFAPHTPIRRTPTMKLIAIAAVLALVAGGVDVEAQKRGDHEGSRDHKLIVT
jgi:hypothetical protein